MDVIVNSDKALIEAIQKLTEEYKTHRYLKISLRSGKTRTLTQNRALHLYCTMLADALNDGGLDQRKTLKPEIDIPWTPDAVKNHLWRPVQVAVTGKESTTKPEAGEYTKIYEVLNRHLSAKLGVTVEWPTKEQ